MSRGAVAAATAVLLGAAFWVGSHSGREASATPLVSFPTATMPGPGGHAGSPGITVTGTAEVAGRPDTLRLDLSVQTRGDTVAKALESANSITARVQSSLRKNGVAGKDIQTSNLQVQPEYSYPTNGGSPVVKGYTVSEGVTATLRDLGKSGTAITAAVNAGGNAVQVNGISLDLEDNGKLLSTARDRAVSNAKTKAEQYAKASGRDLGAVVSIAETVSDPPPVAYDARAMAAKDSASPVPIQVGSENVGVTVTVVYAFR